MFRFQPTLVVVKRYSASFNKSSFERTSKSMDYTDRTSRHRCRNIPSSVLIVFVAIWTCDAVFQMASANSSVGTQFDYLRTVQIDFDVNATPPPKVRPLPSPTPTTTSQPAGSGDDEDDRETSHLPDRRRRRRLLSADAQQSIVDTLNLIRRSVSASNMYFTVSRSIVVQWKIF
jgi:hypothetical protein